MTVATGEPSTRKPTPAPPDGGWGWVVVFASFMIHVIADGVTYTFGIFYYEFLHHFGSSKGTTAWVASIMVGTTFCVGPLASALTTRFGCRAVTVGGALLAGFGLAISTLAPDVTFLFFSIGLCTGAGFGLMYLPSIVSVSCYFERRRAFATGVAVCGSGMGTFALAPLIEHLVELYGWQGAMLVVAGLVLNCAVFGALFRPLEETPPSARTRPQGNKLRPQEPPKLKIGSGTDDNANAVSNGHLSAADDVTSPSTPLMFDASTQPEGATKTTPLSNGFCVSQSKPDLTTPTNGFLKLRPDLKEEGASCRNSLLHPLHRRAEAGPMASFVCSSASLAQTHRELERVRGLMLCRKDVFIGGSLGSLAKCRSNPDLPYRTGDAAGASGREAHGVDLSLLRDPLFLMFAASNFLTSIGFNVPYLYTKNRASELGLGADASLLLSVIGASNTVGRVVLGYLSDRACVNRLYLYNASLLLCGLATALSCLADTRGLMVLYCATFGATAGCYVSLTSVILVDLLGLDRLTNAFGLLLVFEGVSCLLGPPITGWLYDGLGSYDPGFYMSGCMIAASGLILFLVPCVKRNKPTSSDGNPYDPPLRMTESMA